MVEGESQRNTTRKEAGWVLMSCVWLYQDVSVDHSIDVPREHSTGVSRH